MDKILGLMKEILDVVNRFDATDSEKRVAIEGASNLFIGMRRESIFKPAASSADPERS